MHILSLNSAFIPQQLSSHYFNIAKMNVENRGSKSCNKSVKTNVDLTWGIDVLIVACEILLPMKSTEKNINEFIATVKVISIMKC